MSTANEHERAADAPRADAVPAPAAAPSPGPRQVSSAELFGQRHEVLIEHRGALYRLKQTSLGKLILTK